MNQIVFLVNNQRCGYCRKFAPVIEANLQAMNDKARSLCVVAHENEPEGKEWFKRLGYKGGIPCVAAIKPDGTVLEMIPGYKPTEKLGPLLARLMMA
ncbi:TlpA family protein disulfide reductase [Vulcanococcus sp.]|uniref:TlpA family protein disulfide reductase n=1 Tax=Vulcanococcus sp. TaxID=2856995 RepID=UPI003BFCAC28